MLYEHVIALYHSLESGTILYLTEFAKYLDILGNEELILSEITILIIFVFPCKTEKIPASLRSSFISHDDVANLSA